MTLARSGKPLLFVTVGCAAAVMHLAAAFILVSQTGMAPALANVPAFSCAFCVSHAGHSRFSFPSPAYRSHSRLRWLQVSLVSFLLNQGLTLFALHAFPQLWYLAVMAGVAAVVALISYGLGKTWAFAA
jgi:putative flippase GtrA